MSEVIVTESSLADIADAIRAKNGTQNTYKPGQMAAAIEAIPSATIEPLSVTENGTYTAQSGKGYSPVTVNVSGGGGTSLSEGIEAVEAEESVYPASGNNAYIVVTKKPIKTHDWDFTSSLIDSVSGESATLVNGATQGATGITLSEATQNVALPVRFTLNHTYEVDIVSISKSFASGHGRILMFNGSAGFIAQNGGTLKYYSDYIKAWDNHETGGDDVSVLVGKTLKIQFGGLAGRLQGKTYNGNAVDLGTVTFWLDNNLWFQSSLSNASFTGINEYIKIGGNSANAYYDMTVSGFRVYDGIKY